MKPTKKNKVSSGGVSIEKDNTIYKISVKGVPIFDCIYATEQDLADLEVCLWKLKGLEYITPCSIQDYPKMKPKRKIKPLTIFSGDFNLKNIKRKINHK